MLELVVWQLKQEGVHTMQDENISANRVQLVEYDESFLECSWFWLQDEELKKLTMTPDFDKKSQREWFESLPKKQDYLIWGLNLDGRPIGVCGLKNMSSDGGEYWGYIGEKLFWGRGIGGVMLQHLINIARKRELKWLSLQVWKENSRAISLYKKLGFSELEEATNTIHMILEF